MRWNRFQADALMALAAHEQNRLWENTEPPQNFRPVMGSKPPVHLWL